MIELTRLTDRLEDNFHKELIAKAYSFAKQAHDGQVRKGTGEPYFNHPCRVALKVMDQLVDGCKPSDWATHHINIICAALLHDVVEDTSASMLNVSIEFSGTVSTIVGELTDKYTDPIVGNRKTRKIMEAGRLGCVSGASTLIKKCDIYDNIYNAHDLDPEFAKVYIKECQLIMDAMNYDFEPDSDLDLEVYSLLAKRHNEVNKILEAQK